MNDELVIDVAEFRVKRIKYAAITSVAGKVVTTAVQLLAMPIAIRALGPEPFALYAILSSALGWVGLSNIGIGPILTLGIASARVAGDCSSETRLFTSAFLPVLVLSLMIGLVLGGMILLGPTATAFGANYSQYDAIIRFGLMLFLGFALLQSLLSVVEAAQGGYQEQYVFNLWMAIGGGVTLAALIVVTNLPPTVIGLILAVNVPPLISRLINSMRFMKERPHLTPRRSAFDWPESKALLISGLAFSLVGLGSFLTQQVPVILVGRMLDTAAVATFAAIFVAFTIGFGLVTMFASPMLPAIADSMARAEVRWAHKAYVRLMLASMSYACLVGIIFVTLGQSIFRLWFGPSINPDASLMVWFGLYFVLSMWEYGHYIVLMGMKEVRGPSVIFFVRSLLAVALVLIFVPIWGEPGVMIGLCLSIVLVTSWSFPYMVRLAFGRAQRAILGQHGQGASNA